jgi:DegV family protein with EDD domain
MNIAVVTDSTADIPDALAAQFDIHVVRNFITIDGQNYEDGVGISREEFYTRLPGMKESPSTGTAASGVYSALYNRLLEQGAQAIISIHTAAQLSGILNAVAAAARDFGDRVILQDSESTSMGLGFQVLGAAEAAADGRSLPEVLNCLSDLRRRVRVVAMLDTLEYVRRSGRVSWAKARLGSLLQVKPFVEVRDGGKVQSRGEARTRSKGIDRLKELLHSQGELEKLAVLHTNAEADARQIAAAMESKLPQPPMIINITTVIGAHVGPNALGFAAVVKNDPDRR